MVAEGGGRAVLFVLRPGQASELRAAPGMPERSCRLGRSGRVVCDRGYSSDPWRAAIRAAGAEPCVPGQPTHPRAPPHDRSAHAQRHRVENLRARLKEHRAIATRYDKTAASSLGALHLAAALDWSSNKAQRQCDLAAQANGFAGEVLDGGSLCGSG